MYSFHQDPGQLAYSASDKDARALRAFFRSSLDNDRRWFRKHPRAKRYSRPLTLAECNKLHYPHGSELVGHRLSNGQIAWIVYRPAVGDEESPEAIADAVVRCPAFGRTAGEAAVVAEPPVANSSKAATSTVPPPPTSKAPVPAAPPPLAINNNDQLSGSSSVSNPSYEKE